MKLAADQIGCRERAANDVRKDQIHIVPGRAQLDAFLELAYPMRPQRLDGNWRQRDTAATVLRLRFSKDKHMTVIVDRGAHLQRPALQVHIPPFESQELALAHPGRQRQDIQRL